MDRFTKETSDQGKRFTFQYSSAHQPPPLNILPTILIKSKLDGLHWFLEQGLNHNHLTQRVL